MQRAPGFLVPHLTPNKGHHFEEESFTSSRHHLWSHKATAQPKLGNRKSFRCWYDACSFNQTDPLPGLWGFWWHNLLPTEGVSSVSEATSGAVLEELEEGGIWRKGTRQSEILFGENTVHALRQSSGVGGWTGHSGAQNELPASRGWEVWCGVLPPLFWGAHSLQLLLRWRHGCSLE